MNWETLLYRMYDLGRLSPLMSFFELLDWMRQSVTQVDRESMWTERWCIIPVKAGVAKYVLPSDHLVTTGVWFNGRRLNWMSSRDLEFVSPTEPLYYYEDEWCDWSSEAEPGEFATQVAMEPLWPLQLGRAVWPGVKTLTLVAAPANDGPVYNTDPGTGLVYQQTYLDSSVYVPLEGNLLLTYRSTQVEQVSFDMWFEVGWFMPGWFLMTSDEFDSTLYLPYLTRAMFYLYGTEDDEYDRYRSWLFSYMSDILCQTLRGVAVNRMLR